MKAQGLWILPVFVALLVWNIWSGVQINRLKRGQDIPVRPLVTATRDVPTSNEVSDFMNGLDFRCPDGYVIKNPINLRHVTYKVAFNTNSHIECVWKVNP